MGTPTLISTEALAAQLKAEMNKGLEIALEPIIQEAVKKAEITIRREVGRYAIALLDRSYEVYSERERLVITVRHDTRR